MSRINKKGGVGLPRRLSSRKTKPSLEQDFQPELNDPLRVGHHGGDPAHLSRRRIAVRELEIDIVEQVEEFAAELHPHPLSDRRALQQPEVCVEKPWSPKNVSPGVAKRPNGIGREQRGVEVAENLLGMGLISKDGITAGEIRQLPTRSGERVRTAATSTPRCSRPIPWSASAKLLWSRGSFGRSRNAA